MPDAAEPTGDSGPPYISHGYFDPLMARRILKRFRQESIRFDVVDVTGLWETDVGEVYDIRPLLWRPVKRKGNLVELFICQEDNEKARQIIEEI